MGGPDAASQGLGPPAVLRDGPRAVRISVLTPEFDSCFFQTLLRNAPETPSLLTPG